MWKCIVNNIPKCPAAASTQKEIGGREFFKGCGKSEHNHVPDFSKEAELKEVVKAKTDGLEHGELQLRELLVILSNQLQTAGEVVPVKALTLSRSVQRARKNIGG